MSSIDGLVFHRTPGPLLAVVGLCGGAGASTLAYLIAATAAAQSTGPVLVADTGGPTAGLAAYTGVRAARTLAQISEQVAAGEPITGPLWATGENALRVIAGPPQFTVHGDRDGIACVLADARQAHVLSVLDLGCLARPGEQAALAAVTHIAWVMSATATGLERAEQVLARVAVTSRPELLVARAEPGVRSPPVGALADLADTRRAPLVLMPALEDPASESASRLAERAQVTLQAIGGALQG